MFAAIKNSVGEKIDYTFHAGSEKARQIVVIGHGVTGNKDRPFLVALADGLSNAGIPVLRFSFSGNGESEGKFVDSNITKEVADLGSVLDAVAAVGLEICYVGHSMGGAVGVIRAAQDKRISKLISLAGMVDTTGFAQREFGDVEPGNGYMWDKEDCPLSRAYVDDMNSIGSVVDHASQIAVPWLLVHGTEDDVVPLHDSKDILKAAGSNASLTEIPGADHVFSEMACEQMVSVVLKWIQSADSDS